MIFEQVTSGGCQSYLLGCGDSQCALLIDPITERVEQYLQTASRLGLRIRYVLDTHTHADHFSAARELGRRLNALVVTHAGSPTPFADMRLKDGERLQIGTLKFTALHTPGHTSDSLCLVGPDSVFTGDTLLIGGTGRTDLPTGDPGALYDSLFNKLLTLDGALTVYPGHDYKGRYASTLAAEIADNPRLQKRSKPEFVAMMQALNMEAPTHMTEALRVNIHGGTPVSRLLEAAALLPHLPPAQAQSAIADGMMVLDVRGHQAFAAGHIPGAHHIPRGELEFRVDAELPRAGQPILVCCEDGRMAGLAAATLHELGYPKAAVLAGGLKSWRDMGLQLAAL